MIESPMSEWFHEWLNQCPVRWIRDKVDKDYIYYCFEIPDKEDQE